MKLKDKFSSNQAGSEKERGLIWVGEYWTTGNGTDPEKHKLVCAAAAGRPRQEETRVEAGGGGRVRSQGISCVPFKKF